ncbi:MAG TPA: cupin domain-containing protein [Steroidobacteraceae bacterium]|nr:cupin domain-containing protein [Steroidobacteraceae bacterium]
MSEPLNGDLAARVVIDAKSLPWAASPSGTVWRRRLHRVGPPESGQVTSIVRYERGSTFPMHDHPEGEEILVLEGVFSDQHGDWPAGTYLLNPEGFRHAPFSREGCLLFVKLRQFPGRERRHVAADTQAIPWVMEAGRELKPLYSQEGYTDRMYLERLRADGPPAERVYALGAELLVLQGSFEDEHGRYDAQTWLRMPPGFRHAPRTTAGCELYLKEGGFRYLRSA